MTRRMPLGAAGALLLALVAPRAAVAQAVPGNVQEWETLADARFASGDLAGALDAWNHVGQPETGTVTVEGADRTPHPVILKLTGLAPKRLLTPAAFRRAERRLGELPVAAGSAIQYQAVARGATDVRAIIAERSVVPRGPIAWLSVGMNTAFMRELRLGVFGPTGHADGWEFGYRFRENRPRVRVVMAVPSPGPLPGIIDIDATWERQAYDPLAADAPILREERRRASARISDWATGWLRWQAGGAVDRFEGDNFVSVEGQVHTRGLDDRVAATVSAAAWRPTSSGSGFGRTEATTAFRTSRHTGVPFLSGRAGVIVSGDAAPLALWPVASSSNSRGVLLRAHPLFDHGVIVADTFGRRLAFASVEYQRPIYVGPTESLAVAGFVDMARAWNRRVADDAPAEVDAGAGLRVSTPTTGGQIRLDLAYGWHARDLRFSAGYVVPWGR